MKVLSSSGEKFEDDLCEFEIWFFEWTYKFAALWQLKIENTIGKLHIIPESYILNAKLTLLISKRI